MDFAERMQSWRNALTWKRLLWLLLLLPFDLARALLEDRCITRLNEYIDKHSATILAFIARFARFFLTRPITTTLIFAILIVLALVIYAYLETRPSNAPTSHKRGRSKEQQEADRSAARWLQANAKVYSAELLRPLPSDPDLYFELIDDRKARSRSTPFVVINRGGGVARKIQIHPITLSRGAAEFREIDHLDIKAKDERVPEIANCAQPFMFDIFNLFQHEEPTGEKRIDNPLVVPAYATYRDSAESKCFTRHFEIFYYPLRDILYPKDSLFTQIKPIFEIKHGTTYIAPC
jgi:hypothetical protein